MTKKQAKKILISYENGGRFKNHLVNAFYNADMTNLAHLVMNLAGSIFDDLVYAILIHNNLRLDYQINNKSEDNGCSTWNFVLKPNN